MSDPNTYQSTPPISQYTPLDSFRESYFRVSHLLDYISDHLGGTVEVEDELTYELLENVRMLMIDGIRRHVEGGEVALDHESAKNLRVMRFFDDGTPVYEFIDVGAMGTEYFPRSDGDRDSFIRNLRLSAITSQIGALEYEREEIVNGTYSTETILEHGRH